MSIGDVPLLEAYYYGRDHLGSIRELLDDDGQVRARYGYSVLGRRTKLEGDRDADFGFTGLLHQMGTGLAFARYRTYDAATGRWLSRDPLGEFAGGGDYDTALLDWVRAGTTGWRRSGANLYQYTHGDPINRLDLSGRADWEFCVHFIQNERDFCRQHCDAHYDDEQGLCTWFTSSDEDRRTDCYLKCERLVSHWGRMCLRERVGGYSNGPVPDDGGKGAPCYDYACVAAL